MKKVKFSGNLVNSLREAWKKSPRKKKVMVLSAAVILFAAVAGGILIFHRKNTVSAMMGEASVMEITAQTETISDTIVATGNLENDSAVSIKIPSGVVIDEVNVESGDKVSAGDVLATVDLLSVYSTMEAVQETIDILDEEINDCADDSSEETVTAKVDGRVKEIYISEGDSISQIMLEKGALMVLSLDGKMAVEIQTSCSAAVGDGVVVELSDGDEVEGIVESISGKTYLITMTDKGVAADETVTVYSEDGEKMGGGSAYIHQQITVTGTEGTVGDVVVEAEESISSGDTLYTVEKGGSSLEYQEKMAEREAYAETLKKLLLLAKTGTVTADMDGIIENVLVSADSDSNTNSNSANVSVTKTSSSEKSNVSLDTGKSSMSGVQFLNLTSANTEVNGNLSDQENAENNSGNQEDENTNGENSSGGDESDIQNTKLQFEITTQGTVTARNVVIKRPATGETPQKEITASDGSYTGTISWNLSGNVFEQGTSYQALVVLNGGDGYVFGTDSIQKIELGVVSGIQISSDQKTLTFTITFPETEKKEASSDDQEKDNQTDGSQSGESQTQGGQTTDNQTNSEQQSGAQSFGSGSSGGTSGGSQISGNVLSGSGASSGSASTQSTASDSSSGQSSTDSGDENTYSTDTAAFTICGEDRMVLSVSVDELDINTVEVGQEAQLTLDALEDEEFTGMVTKVGNTASASGGVAKYTVEITMDKAEGMRAGMNASATIVIEERENVVTIPVNALQERGQEVFVYTEMDSEGNLSGEQQVTTGLSDGDIVEITEGLSEGDTVYYQKTGSSGSSDTGQMPGNMEGGRDMGSGMGGPDMGGGDMNGGSSDGRMGGGNMGGGTPPGQ